MKNEELQILTKIPLHEAEEFAKRIKQLRKTYIKSPKDTVEIVVQHNQDILNVLKRNGNISEVLRDLREEAYSELLREESLFNIQILKELTDRFETPSAIINKVISDHLSNKNPEDLIESIKIICAKYTGLISPYIYALSLSNTQSRRSRAGKTFEAIVYKIYEVYGYEYVSQGQIGKQTFKEKGLGKMVDSLLPSVEAFEKRRDKVVIGTMKTTLRERWQEVVEEIVRTGLPKIYLLTVDTSISKSKAEQLGKHNVVLVVLDDVKDTKALKDLHNIISFEDYFLEEVPDILKYWNV